MKEDTVMAGENAGAVIKAGQSRGRFCGEKLTNIN
jgi:hypothetical protein